MKMDSLRRYAPYLAPVVIAGLGWAVLIRPASSENARIAGELVELRQRIATVRSQNPGPGALRDAGVDPVAAFEQHVASGDASGRLLEELSRIATASGIRIDTLETGEQGDVGTRSGPAVADAATPDPRLALFEASLKYSPVTLTAEADYPSLGAFLWRLRNLGTLTEVRTLDVTAPPPSGEAPVDGTLRVTLMLFAYSRIGSGIPESGPRTLDPESRIASAEAAE